MPSLTLANSLRATITYSPFSPASLFSGGAPGVWYDPSSVLLDWRYNLLTYTEQFDDAVWTKTNASITPNTTTAPDGATTADSLIEDSASAWHRLNSATFSYTGTYTLSIAAKANTRGWLAFCFYADAVAQITYFDLTNGAVGTNAAGSTAAITSLGDGWYRCSVTRTLTGGISQMILAPSTGNNVFSYAGNGTSGIYIWGASLTTAANASLPYQQIVTPEISYLTYQPQPILFQDSAGTTPVTAVEQPVGLMLDKSRGLVLGSDALGGNGTFPSGSYWGVSSPPATLSGGQVVFSGSASLGGAYTNSAPLTIGIYYEISFEVVSITQGGVKVWAGLTIPSYTATTVGTHTYRVLCLGDGLARVYNNGTATTAAVDNVTIKPVLGNHAFQSTSASRPVLSARYNLLTKTEEFNDAVWAKSNGSISANATVAPDGTTTADAFNGNGVSTFHTVEISGGITLTSGVSYTYSVRVKANVLSLVQLASNAGVASGAQRANFDLSAGTVGTFDTADASITSLGSGWYKCSITVTANSTAAKNVYLALTNSTTASFAPSFATSDGIFIWGADLRVSNNGTTQPAYQRVNTSTDYNTTGFLPYLKFDGVDDSMSTNSINFTSTDKMSVFAGVRKLSDGIAGNYGCIAELSTILTTNNGTFNLFGPANAPGGSPDFGFSSKGSLQSTAVATSNAAPITRVLTGQGDIGADISILRVNGIQAASNTSNQGTGNFGNYPLYIGRRGGTIYAFNGQIYSMTIVGKQVTATELSSTETYTAIKTGVTLA